MKIEFYYHCQSGEGVLIDDSKEPADLLKFVQEWLPKAAAQLSPYDWSSMIKNIVTALPDNDFVYDEEQSSYSHCEQCGDSNSTEIYILDENRL